METPLAKAAKRGGIFRFVPMMLAFQLQPRDCRYLRTSGAMPETEPASASPNPSRIDFLPSSRTFSGMSGYCVSTMNPATYFVRPGDCGNAEGACFAPAAGFACPAPPAFNAESASALLKKLRRIISPLRRCEEHCLCRSTAASLREAG